MSSVVTTQPYYTKIIAPYKLLIGYVRYIQISLTWLRDIQGKMANSLSFFWVVIPNTNIEPRNHVRIMIYWTWPKMRKQWLFTFRQLVVSERKIIQQTKPLITRYRLDHCSYRWVIRFIARQGLKILRWFCSGRMVDSCARLRIDRFRSEPWPGKLSCILWQDSLISSYSASFQPDVNRKFPQFSSSFL